MQDDLVIYEYHQSMQGRGSISPPPSESCPKARAHTSIKSSLLFIFITYTDHLASTIHTQYFIIMSHEFQTSIIRLCK